MPLPLHGKGQCNFKHICFLSRARNLWMFEHKIEYLFKGVNALESGSSYGFGTFRLFTI